MNPRRYLPRNLPAAIEPQVPLALDLRWNSSHDADPVWRAIDPGLWEATRNPWLILETVSLRRLESLAQDREFLAVLGRVAAEREAYLRLKTWVGSSGAPLRRVAFFSMEFGLGETLALYSGGLGVLAGDYLKSASDLGVPVVGVGLLYQQGYFRQAPDSAGEQLAFNPYNPPTMLPRTPTSGTTTVCTSSVAMGGSCVDTAVCPADGYCDPTTNVCTKLPAIGEPCTPNTVIYRDPTQAAAVCDMTTSTCQALTAPDGGCFPSPDAGNVCSGVPDVGSACTPSDLCTAGTACTGGICTICGGSSD